LNNAAFALPQAEMPFGLKCVRGNLLIPNQTKDGGDATVLLQTSHAKCPISVLKHMLHGFSEGAL
jgi:hypothetical protein